MRLRYLHLPRCGPLVDAAIVFGREELVSQALQLPRKGTLNFIVGVNGTGKSSLLRVLYRTFRSIQRREWPVLPLTLAWDRVLAEEYHTALLHYPAQKENQPFFALLPVIPATAGRGDWALLTSKLMNDERHPFIEGQHIEISVGEEAIDAARLFAALPKRLIAYTSGVVDPWVSLDHPLLQVETEMELDYRIEDERPTGWSRQLEKAQAQPLSAGLQVADAFARELEDDLYFRLDPGHLRLAGITVALWQAAKDLTNRNAEFSRLALRTLLLDDSFEHQPRTGLRRVFNQIDWFYPTHLSLIYRADHFQASAVHLEQLLCMVTLADDVLALPNSRMRLVLSLGPTERITLSEKLQEAFPLGLPRQSIEFIAARVDGCKTGAEAVLRVFSPDNDIDSTPMDLFTRLRQWQRSGLLEEVTLTIKRLHQVDAADGESDDTLITYDQLSDGEQMLLGRMGFIQLLRGQDGSLLLLDEPETHFNDVWKREIVGMVNDGLLNSTAANVIVATHTSIALTDAFAAEVTVLDKIEGAVNARGVRGGLFGTDPGEVSMNLFRADSSTGRRSEEILDQLLKTEWKGKEKELEAILDLLGSSFHRAELRAILKKLRQKTDGASSR